MGMLESIFDIPLVIAGPMIIGSLCAFAIVGLLLVRRIVLPRLRIRVEDSEFSGSMLQAVMVFYGLAVALIAVSVFETYSDVSAIISEEASEIGALYRDASSYPEPTRQQLQSELRDYARYVIDTAWPAQRRGEVALHGVAMLNRFQATMTRFEPATEGQRALHAEALRAYNSWSRCGACGSMRRSTPGCPACSGSWSWWVQPSVSRPRSSSRSRTCDCTP
jgi:hypothetical protein